MEQEDYIPDSDLDLSFTSTATTATTAATFSARSSLALSFNERLSSASNPSSTSITAALRTSSHHRRPHRRHENPNWSSVTAAANLSSDGAIHLRHLKLIRQVGSGNLGRVFLCRLRDYDNANFALKVVDRDTLSSKKLAHVETEAEVLSGLDHPFLPTLYARLEVSHYTCLLMDYCPNGDLHSLLRRQPNYRLPLQSVRFYAAEVLLALEYLHAKGIVYRDLKPENILIREDGHVMLSDFDLCLHSDTSPRLETRRQSTARSRRRSNFDCLGNRRRLEEQVTEFVAEPTSAFSKSCVGTHEYLAPELAGGNGHGSGVDWWAFGVLLYELLYGATPFKGATKEETLRNIVSTREVRFHAAECDRMEPRGMFEARDLIEKLLAKDPRKRLGCDRGAAEIKRHPFFDGVRWPLIRMSKVPEVRGLQVKRSSSSTVKSSAHVGSHVTGALAMSSPRRKRWFWKKLRSYVARRIKGYSSGHRLSSNYNYYSSVNYRT